MSKLTKLLTQPSAFFGDAYKKHFNRSALPKVIFTYGFSYWKQYLRSYFPDEKLILLPKEMTEQEFFAVHAKKVLKQKNARFFVWSSVIPPYLEKFLQQHQIPRFFVEDGFLRSVKLGASQAPTRSLCVDSRASHFDSRGPSDLEVLLQTHPFDDAIRKRARKAMNLLLQSRLSKYNHVRSRSGASTNSKSRRRVLIVGQVEDDASIRYGCSRTLNNNDTIRLAAEENPDAEIIYKVHPDVINRHREHLSDPNEVRDICTILDTDISLPDALEGIDHVYTITSLGGFEALIRGIKVTTLGCPFYSGWGLTDDRQPNARRTRKLTVEEVFAAAYLLYPLYFDPKTGQQTTFEASLKGLITEINSKKTATKRSADSKSKTESTPLPSLTPFDWFITQDNSPATPPEKPTFLYVPWIAEHGDSVFRPLKGDDFQLASLDLFANIRNPIIRKTVNAFALNNAAIYRRMVLRRLLPWRGKTAGILFSFDWAPAMRIIESACRELGIPTILIPHESVFVNRNLYYTDPKAHASIPNADVILGWGELQKAIYTERGYPADRFLAVGAPKFDRLGPPSADRAIVCKLLGLDPETPIILFAAQPLDSQMSVRIAREAQREAIYAIMQVLAPGKWQLLLRMPPSNDEILDEKLRQDLADNRLCAIDEASSYLLSPGDALEYCEMVTSVNSTMLLEGMLMGKRALSLNFIGIESLWSQAKIPMATEASQVAELIESLSHNWCPDPEGMAWAASAFSPGSFDNRASERISHKLSEYARERPAPLPSALDRVLDPHGGVIDVAAIHSPLGIAKTTQRYIAPLLNVRRLLYSRAAKSPGELASVDLFINWGITPGPKKQVQTRLAREMGREQIIIEDGFIRSVDIGLSGEPCLSIIIDDTTAYYDATRPSRLTRLLESSAVPTDAELERSRAVMAKLVEERISKYNHAPNRPYPEPRIGRKRILLIDQRHGDQSVVSGLGTEASFHQMLEDALALADTHDVLIKQHPDALTGGKNSYFAADTLSRYSEQRDRIEIIDFEINPYALFEVVDEVYVVTSGMGYEALLAGKKVRCYGAPFYAGWGLTEDLITIPARSRQRSLAEVFHYAYIECSRYYSPEAERRVEIEELLSYIVKARGWSAGSSNPINQETISYSPA